MENGCAGQVRLCRNGKTINAPGEARPPRTLPDLSGSDAGERSNMGDWWLVIGGWWRLPPRRRKHGTNRTRAPTNHQPPTTNHAFSPRNK